MSKRMVKMSLHISPELNEELEQMSEEAHASKSDVLRKSIALMKVALDSKKAGRKLAIVNDRKELINEIIGLWVLILIGLVMIQSVFIYFGWRTIENPNDKWSMAITSSIISAFLGYTTGKRNN